MRYRAALLFALLFALLLALLLAIPAPAMVRHRADWMQEAKWGVTTHYLADWQARVNKLTMSVDTWNGLIDHFDVEALARQLQSVGARYYQISIGQNSGYYLSPNSVYDELAARSMRPTSVRSHKRVRHILHSQSEPIAQPAVS